MNLIKIAQWRSSRISMDSDGIILITPTEDIDHELEDLKDFQKFIRHFTNNETHYAITDLRNFHFKVSKEATNYVFSESKITEKVGGNAFLIDSLPNRITINFVRNFYTPPYPFRAFGEYGPAHKWLLKLKRKDTCKLI